MNRYGTVLILYNAPSGSSGFEESESGVLDEVRAVAASLSALDIPFQEIGIRSLRELCAALMTHRASLAVNLVESFAAEPADAFLVPATCRAFRLEVTGNTAECLALSTDKWKTKALLSAAGLRCPAGVAVPVGGAIPSSGLPRGALIVKPLATDASEGIDSHSIADSPEQLKRLVADIHVRFQQPALIEEMVGQREINVSMLQTGESVKILPPAEIDFSAFPPGKPRIVGYAAKWKKDSFEYSNTPRIFSPQLSPEQNHAIRDMALRAWDTLGCRDHVRVDFRLDDDGAPVILEINANPDISPDAGFAAALRQAGIPYDDFVRALLDNASARSTPRATAQVTPARATAAPAKHVIRRAEARDREGVINLLNQPEFFRPDELAIAREVFDDAIKGGESGHYQSFIAEYSSAVSGWICYGPTPCTLGTFDIYWIAVSAEKQRRGIGAALMEFAEENIRKRAGRLSVIETSSRLAYDSTRAFYAGLGYAEAARIKDFYAPGDDKIVSIKALS